MKKVLSVVLCIVVALSLATSVFALQTVAVKSISLNKTSATLDVGKSVNLAVSFTPANTTQKVLTFSTSNKNVASVDAKGTVTAVNGGTAVITVTSASNNALVARCSITVTQALKPVTLKWLLRIAQQPMGADVLAEVNKQIKSRINATLDIQFIDAASYPEKTKLMIAASEPFDMMFTAVGYGYFDYVAKGAYVPLNGLLEKYAPTTKAQIPAGFWKATTVGGKIYGIPNYQIAARVSTINFLKSVVDKYGIDVSKIKTLESLQPVLENIWNQGVPSDKYIFAPPSLTYFDTMNYLGLEQIGAEGSVGAIQINGEGYKVINQFEAPTLVKMVKLMKNWADHGLINKNLSLIKDQNPLNKAGKVLISAIGNYKPGIEASNAAAGYPEMVFDKITSPYVNTSSILGTLQAISRTSQNPERALMFLDIVNSDPKVYNTLVYGIEGRNYTKVGDKKIQLIPNSGYAGTAWMMGNTLNGYFLPGAPTDVNDQVVKLNQTSKVSRIMGFNFDPTPVKDELAACLAVKDKYAEGLRYGMFDDVDATLAKFKSDLAVAGMDKVIAEKQKQLNDWVAVNKKK